MQIPVIGIQIITSTANEQGTHIQQQSYQEVQSLQLDVDVPCSNA
jgi:hypothetical protein